MLCLLCTNRKNNTEFDITLPETRTQQHPLSNYLFSPREKLRSSNTKILASSSSHHIIYKLNSYCQSSTKYSYNTSVSTHNLATGTALLFLNETKYMRITYICVSFMMKNYTTKKLYDCMYVCLYTYENVSSEYNKTHNKICTLYTNPQTFSCLHQNLPRNLLIILHQVQ